jgi:hypothetical protein
VSHTGKSRWRTLGLFWAAILLTGLACSLPGGITIGPTPTRGPLPTATPLGDFILFDVPRYEATLLPGERVPSTQLVYERRTGDSYDFTINGLLASKREGNSLIWSGIVAPGVTGRYTLAVTARGGDSVTTTGSILLTILSPLPVAVNTVSAAGTDLYFQEIDVSYVVPLNARVPGTTLIYEGVVAASNEARFSGTNSGIYPQYAQGDTIIWTGQLRGNVLVSYAFEVLRFDGELLELDGTAELWIQSRNR